MLPEHLVLGLLHEQEGLAARTVAALRHNYIGTEHILLGLLEEEENVGGGPLAGLGITRERAQDWLVPVLERMAEAKRQGR